MRRQKKAVVYPIALAHAKATVGMVLRQPVTETLVNWEASRVDCRRDQMDRNPAFTHWLHWRTSYERTGLETSLTYNQSDALYSFLNGKAANAFSVHG